MTARAITLSRVAIVGGGITGLACALALARRGASVIVHESGPGAGQGALVKSGGMLAQGFESASERAGAAFAELAAHSLSLWPRWAADIEAASGQSIGFRQGGSIAPALSAEDEVWLAGMEAGAPRHGIEFERLDARALRAAVPGLSADVRSGLRFPFDGEVDNRALGPALVSAARRAGVAIRTASRITSLTDLEADRILIATGYTGPPPLVPEMAHIAPVKGQMIAFDGTTIPLECSLRGRRIYLSRKPDGRLVAGATSEAGRADLTLDPDTRNALRDAAVEMIPALAQAAITDQWAGIRPASPDGLPLLGVSADQRAVVALGAYRNGVLLAPAIGEAMAALILDDCAPNCAFDPARFEY